MRPPRTIADLPPLARATLLGAAACGVVGFVVGLLIGWRAYPPTAWAAGFEIGIPAAVVGVLVGALLAIASGLLRRNGLHSAGTAKRLDEEA